MSKDLRERFRLWYWLRADETLFGASAEHMHMWKLLVSEIFKTDTTSHVD